MACAKYCYDKTVSADKVMACALEHWPPNMQVARDAAQRPLGINGTNSEGWNLLHIACLFYDVETAGLAVARGLDSTAAVVTRRGPGGQTWAGPIFSLGDRSLTALHLAVGAESVGVLRVLLRVPKVRNQLVNKKVSIEVLCIATRPGNAEMLSLVLEAIASMKDLSRNDCFPRILIHAMREGYMDGLRLLVQFLISERSHEFSEGKWRLDQLLFLAIQKQSKEIVGFLVDSFGIAVLGPGPGIPALYGFVICATAFDSRNNVAILEKLKALAHAVMGSRDRCPLLAECMSDHHPICLDSFLAVLKQRQLSDVAEMGIELQEPAPENATFLTEWIAEDDKTRDSDDSDSSIPAKRRRLDRTQNGGSV